MKAQILDGKIVAEHILSEVRNRARGKHLALAVVQVGDNKASDTYIAEKQKTGAAVGIEVRVFRFPESVPQKELVEQLDSIGHNPEVSGLIVQLPLPTFMNREEVLNHIPLEKDVDVLSTGALERFQKDASATVPPTVCAVKSLLSFYGVDISDKQFLVVGYGRLVGMPICMWLKREGVRVEVAEKETRDIKGLTERADIIVSGVGKANVITGDIIKQDAIVIDAGTSVEEGKTKGDVDFESVAEKAMFITPVPGGVGPVTVACLLRNVVEKKLFP